MPQVSAPVDGLNAEELTVSGVKVEILKKLMLKSNSEDTGTDAPNTSNSPPQLIALDQITVRGEDLTGERASQYFCLVTWLRFVFIAGLMFAQFPMPSDAGPASQVSSGTMVSAKLSSIGSSAQQALSSPGGGYMELGDGQVMEILSKHLALFQSSPRGDEDDSSSPAAQQGSAVSITLYREALEHCARLSRIMVSPHLRFVYNNSLIILAWYFFSRIYLGQMLSYWGQREVEESHS